MAAPVPRMHGRDHAPGGADPIPGIGGATLAMLATWNGALPTSAPSYGSVWRVPYLDGTGVLFNLTRAFARVETAGASSTAVRIESSPAGTFVASTVATLTIAAAANEDEDTSLIDSVASGQLLRIVFPTTPGTTGSYTVQLEGEAA